ncbi:AGAP008770-PA-like protein [Anopheles sinensis]|uniref:AGAP008770-PA-like protein n=1 Tax=Anopheles sinensis TaxID=74873 RepID=A0A084VMR1_ANOSI|nr:AGAP008770-PA-like protein [Anopheles sinensis]
MLETIEASNISLDISHYNALLRVYWDNEHRFSATDFLAELESKGLQPNRVTYQKLLLCSCFNGEIKEANKIFDAMKEKGLGMSQYILDMLIITNSKADELDAVTEMLEETIGANNKLSAFAFYSLLCACARKGDTAYMSQTLETCKKNNIIMREEGFIMILQSLADSGHGIYGNVLDDLSKIFSLVSTTKQFESFDRAEIIEADNITECQDLAKSLNDLMFDAEPSTEDGQKRMLIILKNFINVGLTISKRLEEKLTDLYAENIDFEFKNLLGRLNEIKSGTTDKASSAAVEHLSVPELEELIVEMTGMGLNVNALRLQLIRSLIRSNDQEKLVALLQRLEDENFEIIPDIYEEAVEMYVKAGKSKDAEKLLGKIRIKNPKFALSRVVLLRVAKVLFDNNQFVDTLRFLQENVPSTDQTKDGHDQPELDVVYIHAYWEFLVVLMNKCNDDQINTRLPFVFVVNLIKVHLTRYDTLLFPVTNHEEDKILLDQCEKESNVDRIEELKELRKKDAVGSPSNATESINEKTQPAKNRMPEPERQNQRSAEIDNSTVDSIFQICQESSEMIQEVHDILAQNQFRKPEQNLMIDVVGDLLELQRRLDAQLNQNWQAIHKNLSNASKLVLENTKRTQNLLIEHDKALQLAQQKKTEHTQNLPIKPEIQNKWSPTIDNDNLREQSKLLQAMLSFKDLSSATKLVLDILQKKCIPHSSDFEDFLEAAAINGQIGTFDRIDALLPDSVKSTISFDLYYQWADISGGNLKKHLDNQLQLSRKLRSKQEATESIEDFCIVGSCWGLKKKPELVGLFTKVADNYAEWGVMKPYEVLWQHYFLCGESEKELDVWNDILMKYPGPIPIEEILHVANETYDATLCRRLITLWCKTNVDMDKKGVYDSLIDILLAKKNPASALRLMKYVEEQSVELEEWTEQWLQSSVEFHGWEFPY